jgi:hypothetical protein
MCRSRHCHDEVLCPNRLTQAEKAELPRVDADVQSAQHRERAAVSGRATREPEPSEPAGGFEPSTPTLQKWCSSTELCRPTRN